MIDVALIQGAVSSLKIAGDIAKSFLELKSIADVQGKVIELQSAILSAQGSALAAQGEQSSMVQRIRDLEEEIADIKAWETQKQRYKLVSPWNGTLVYALKKECGDSEPPHWICTKCYEDGSKSFLSSQEISHKLILVCNKCKSHLQTPWRGGSIPFEFAEEVHAT